MSNHKRRTTADLSRRIEHFYDSDAGIVLEIEGKSSQCLGRWRKGGRDYLDFEGGVTAVAEAEPCGDLTLWKWRLENNTSQVSRVITRFNVLRLCLPCKGAIAPILHGGRGGLDQAFFPPESWRQWTSCYPTESLTYDHFRGASKGGRSSNDAFPFFVFQEALASNRCWIAALGWSGDWDFGLFREAELSWLQLGMCARNTNMRLYPGESILQPELLLGCYLGKAGDAQRHLRGLLRDRLQPELEGRTMRPFTFWNHYFGDRGRMTEASFLKNIEHAAKLGLDYVILDGGWTGGGLDGDFSSLLPHIGSWRPDPGRFPKGLKRITTALQKVERKLGLWFDIEEAHERSEGCIRHPELFFNHVLSTGCRILRLDTLAGKDWALETISKNVSATDARWIRYDFNANPAHSWSTADSWDRKGITECNYVHNLYRLMDALRNRFPNLLIENTASGGRRIDLAILRRTHADWFSDHTQSEAIIRYHLQGAGRWLPAHRLNTSLAHTYLEPNRPVDWKQALPASAYLSHFGGNFGMSDYPDTYGRRGRSELKKFISLYKETADYFAGDFYPLGQQDAMLRGPAGFAGIHKTTGKAAAILFGSLEAKLDCLSSGTIERLLVTKPMIADEGAEQFPPCRMWVES